MDMTIVPLMLTAGAEAASACALPFRLLKRAVLCAFFSIMITQQVVALELPAHVSIVFSTTTTVEQSHNPRVLNGVALFPLQANLYSAVDGLPEETPILSLNLKELKVSIPAVRVAGAPEEQVVIWQIEGRLEYKIQENGPLLALCTLAGQLSNRERLELSCTPGTDFHLFAQDLNYDVTTDNTSTRRLDKMFLFSTIRVYNGSGTLPHSLDLDITFTADAVSKVKLD